MSNPSKMYKCWFESVSLGLSNLNFDDNKAKVKRQQ